MEFIDSHCHLYASAFDADREEALQAARIIGVSKFILPNVDLDSLPGMWDLVHAHPKICYPSLGLHPCSVKENVDEVLAALKMRLDSEDYVAIGEIGMDLYWDKNFLAQQETAFLTQCAWAKEKNMPIIIHSRDSFDELFALLDTVNDAQLRGVFHCFTGNEAQAKKIMEYGNFYLGLGGVLTFKNSGVSDAIANIPLEKILLETDSPYLAPHPYRGKRNEPKYIPLIAEKLALVKNLSLAEVAQQTTTNVHSLFAL